MNYYYDNTENRIGDEIMMTAVIKYFSMKNIKFYYKDFNQYLSSINIFNENSVVFTADNFYEFPTFDPINLWFWCVFLKSKKIYTEVKQKHESKKHDVVFVPILDCLYHKLRELNKDTTLEIFYKIISKYPNSKMILDKHKKDILGIEHPAIIYSDNIYETFDYIKNSRVYIGCDTGTSHYAGAIKHPNMILIYPDELYMQGIKKNTGEKEIMSEIFQEPFYLYDYSAVPCCDPNHYKVFNLENNSIDSDLILNTIQKSI